MGAKLVSDLSNSLSLETLLIDVGNTRIKYAIGKDKGNQLEVKTTESVETILQNNPNVKKVVMGSVKNNTLTQQTIALCQSMDIQIINVETEARRFGVECAYTDFHNLGVDRWLAILAARLHTQFPVAVIDAGTAITCDVVVGQKHLGGWIGPGFSMMRDSVTKNADKVFGNQLRPEKLEFGSSTEDCVNFGCMALLQGAVMRAQTLLESYAHEYRIYLCGGDVDLIQLPVSDKVQLKPNLVLEGLGRYAG